MIETFFIFVLVSGAALHIGLRLLPQPQQRRVNAGIGKAFTRLGLSKLARPFLSTTKDTIKSCGDGCSRCSTAPVDTETALAKVVQFHPRKSVR